MRKRDSVKYRLSSCSTEASERAKREQTIWTQIDQFESRNGLEIHDMSWLMYRQQPDNNLVKNCLQLHMMM